MNWNGSWCSQGRLVLFALFVYSVVSWWEVWLWHVSWAASFRGYNENENFHSNFPNRDSIVEVIPEQCRKNVLYYIFIYYIINIHIIYSYILCLTRPIWLCVPSRSTKTKSGLVPVQKVKSNNPSDYRPVVHTSHSVKVFEENDPEHTLPPEEGSARCPPVHLPSQSAPFSQHNWGANYLLCRFMLP